MYKILIVDDEKIERSGIQFLLKQTPHQYETEEAVNGLEALELLRKNHYDILLTDVKMPFMDGIRLLETLREEKIEVKSIIFSGCNEFDYAKRAIRLGVQDYILKPVDPREFHATLDKVAADLEEEIYEKNLKTKSLEYMKEHALYLLANGMSYENVLKKYTQFSESELFDPYKRVLLLEFSHNFFGKKELNFSDEDLSHTLVADKVVNLNEQQAVLFLGTEPADIVKTINRYWEKIRDLTGEKFHIAVSGELKKADEIPKAMEDLELLMENRFFHPEIPVYIREGEKNSDSLISMDDDTLMKQMKQDIKMKNVESLREHFDRFCTKYQKKTDYSQIYIKFLFSNLLKDIYSNLDEGDSVLNREIEKLYMVGEFEEVRKIIEDALVLLEKKYNDCPEGGHKEVEVIKHYIYKHYDEELGIDMLADMVYMAPSYLSTVFKKETGQNLSKFIKAYRMDMAKNMLENSLLKIVDIGLACGYPNVSYFCSSFREYFGISPQKFRENGGDGNT